jgi:hypothetical protein
MNGELARVRRGVGLPERNPGPDWPDPFDPATLELRGLSRCVLGQVIGGYDGGLTALGLNEAAAARCAFSLTDAEAAQIHCSHHKPRMREPLQQAWLQARRAFLGGGYRRRS